MVAESRHRIHSNRQSNPQREEKTAVANAMKILQDKIAALEEENARMRAIGSNDGSRQNEEVASLQLQLKDRDEEIAKITHYNEQMVIQSSQLKAEIKRLEE